MEFNSKYTGEEIDAAIGFTKDPIIVPEDILSFKTEIDTSRVIAFITEIGGYEKVKKSIDEGCSFIVKETNEEGQHINTIPVLASYTWESFSLIIPYEQEVIEVSIYIEINNVTVRRMSKPYVTPPSGIHVSDRFLDQLGSYKTTTTQLDYGITKLNSNSTSDEIAILLQPLVLIADWGLNKIVLINKYAATENGTQTILIPVILEENYKTESGSTGLEVVICLIYKDIDQVNKRQVFTYTKNTDTGIITYSCEAFSDSGNIFKLGNKLFALPNNASFQMIDQAFAETPIGDIENAYSNKMIFYGYPYGISVPTTLDMTTSGNVVTITYVFTYNNIYFYKSIKYDKSNHVYSTCISNQYSISEPSLSAPFILDEGFWIIDPLGPKEIDSEVLSYVVGGVLGLEDMINIVLKTNRPFVLPHLVKYDSSYVLGDTLGNIALTSVSANVTATTKQISFSGIFENYIFNTKITYDTNSYLFSILKTYTNLTII